MASSNDKFPVNDPATFYNNFPHLNEHNHTSTSKATPPPNLNFGQRFANHAIYNCFAFAIGDKSRFWWPDCPLSYWPRKNAPGTVDEIARVLREDFDYEDCLTGEFEDGVKKIAIFEKNGVATHVALQPSSRRGVWKSKMGYNINMEHELRAIETLTGDNPDTQGYGLVVKFMQLKMHKRRR
jgi:hypothetical protein